MATKQKIDLGTDITAFSRAFATENDLQEAIAELLRNIGHHGVRITHGRNEKGKDIESYVKAGLGKSRLEVCVVKNERIKGDFSSACSASNVLFQVNAALAEPRPNPTTGVDEWVDRVYVMSPYEPTQQAVDSIKNQIQRPQRVEFICGADLFDLFVEHYLEFLVLHSNVLQVYLASLKEEMNRDTPLATLISQRGGLLGQAARPFGGLYVRPTFELNIGVLQFDASYLEASFLEDLKTRAVTLSQLRTVEKRVRALGALLASCHTWIESKETCLKLEKVAESVESQVPRLQEAWERGFLYQASEDRSRGSVNIVPKSKAQVVLNFDSEQSRWMTECTHAIAAATEEICERIRHAERFIRTRHESLLTAIADPLSRAYFSAADLTRSLPGIVERGPASQKVTFGEDLLDASGRSVLVTGPAGLGKTSFCRWNAMRDASLLQEGESDILPIYNALHGAGLPEETDFFTAFVRDPQLRRMLEKNRADQRNIIRLRFYFDGLDEVSNVEDQERIAELIRTGIEALPNVQVIITARDYVFGKWLTWLPRVELAEFDEQRVCMLVKNWVDDDEDLARAFFGQVDSAPALKPLLNVPLLASLILAVHQRGEALPPNKVKLYDLFVELLSGGWDFVKRVQRNVHSGRFDKITVLTGLAGRLHMLGRADGTEDDFRHVIADRMPHYADRQVELLNELLQDGLLVKVGQSFAFKHLSFQEYLAARDLLEPSGFRAKQAAKKFFHGDDWWREVMAFYVSMQGRAPETARWLELQSRNASRTAPRRLTDLQQRLGYLKHVLDSSFAAGR